MSSSILDFIHSNKITGAPYQTAEEAIAATESEIVDRPEAIRLPNWPHFNELTGGLRLHESTLICAPTGAGKTQFIANISAQLVAMEIPHFVAPVETGRADYLLRLYSIFDGQNHNHGDPLKKETYERLKQTYGETLNKSGMLLGLYEDRLSVEQMVTTLFETWQRYKIKVALLDNLNFFLEVTSSSMEKHEMDTAIHTFIMAAKKLPIHIILITHPRKTDNGEVMSEFDIKGSSTAVQEASNVFLYNRVNLDHPNDGLFLKPNSRKLKIAKLRKRGESCGKHVYFNFTNGRLDEVKPCITVKR